MSLPPSALAATLLLLGNGCLIDRELYEQRSRELADDDGDGFNDDDGDCDDADPARYPGATEICDGIDQDCDLEIDDGASSTAQWFTDADGDGFGTGEALSTGCSPPGSAASTGDDCDDTDPTTYPGAAEVWYDGKDEDCGGDDDYDADQDGDPIAEGGGADCDDTDPRRSSIQIEGWTDIGTDNDCDGTIQDQVTLDVGSISRIDGVDDQDTFGSAMVLLPTGWGFDEETLLVAAGRHGNYSGAFYGFPESTLADASTSQDAAWIVEGEGFLGYSLGYGGDTTSPVVFAGEATASISVGAVRAWTGAEIGQEEPTFSVLGDSDDLYVGGTILSGVDLDGDGSGDLVVNAILDSRVASNAGSVAVFLAPAGLRGDLSYADFDVLFTTATAGASLTPINTGDTDDDGRPDLGFGLTVPEGEAPGTLLTSVPWNGLHDVDSESVAKFYYCQPHTATDLDGDGSAELLALGGIVWQIDLPVAGSVVPWKPEVGYQAFADPAVDWAGTLAADVPYWDGRRALIGSYVYDESRGAVALDSLSWGHTSTLEDAKYLLHGEYPGDLFGSGAAIVDHDGDGVRDLAISAPAADGLAADGGTVYLVPSPQ